MTVAVSTLRIHAAAPSPSNRAFCVRTRERRVQSVGSIGKYKLNCAWIVLFAACMLDIASRADHGSFGVFVEHLVELFGWSRGDISAAYSVAFGVSR